MDEALLEAIIRQLQQNGGYSNDKDLPQYPPHSETWGSIRNQLIQFGFIVPNQPGFTLTKEGWTFTSFADIREEKKLQKDLLISNKKAADATESLSTKTEAFYKKQTGFNDTQRGLTWAIVIATSLYTIFAALSYFNSCNASTPCKCPQNTQIQSQHPLQSLDTSKPILRANDSAKKK